MLLRYTDLRFELDEEQERILQDKRDKKKQKVWGLKLPLQISSYDDYAAMIIDKSQPKYKYNVVAKRGPHGDVGWTSAPLYSHAKEIQDAFRITSEEEFVEYFNSNGILSVSHSYIIEQDDDHVVLSGPSWDFLIATHEAQNNYSMWERFIVVGKAPFDWVDASEGLNGDRDEYLRGLMGL